MTRIANLVHQKTSSSGTGAMTLDTLNGRRSFFSAFGSGGADMFFYFIAHLTAAEWEVGTGHLSDATTLVRDTVIASSNANSLVSFSPGLKDVVNDAPAHLQSQLETLSADLSGKEPVITAGTSAQYWRGDKTFQALNKAAVGLGSVDNTADANKPVSTAVQAALDLKYDALNPGGYISYVVADGQSVTGDGVSVPLESHTKYDQSISSGYEVQNSDNDKVFDDTLGDIILTLTSITQLPFSFTVINTVGNTIMIPYDGYTFYVGNVIAVGNHLSCNTVGSSAKVRIHTTGKVMIETSGYWREAS